MVEPIHPVARPGFTAEEGMISQILRDHDRFLLKERRAHYDCISVLDAQDDSATEDVSLR